MSPTDNTHVVTAVIVTHDGAAWVTRTAQALLNQTRPLQRVVAVDTGSRDRSGAMLAELLGRGCVFGMERSTGYGAAVHQALRHRAANTHVRTPGAPQDEPTEWVWLLHDDCEPAPDALEQLLRGAAQAPAAAVLGPKVREWSDRNVLLEVGVTIDRACRRVTGIEPREVDQGQHDGDRDVLAVSSAGMLVRRDVWDEVGGFDPGLRLYRDDVDFCWRVQAAGFRVRVITDAVVHHVEASARNRRQASAAPRRGRQDRRNALRVLLGNLPAGPMLSALAGNLVLSALRTVFFLIAKRPGAAVDELAAVTSVAGHPLRLLAARRRRARGRRAAFARLRGDLPPGRSLRRLAEYASATLSKSLPADVVGTHHATEDPSDDDSLLVDNGIVQRLLTNPGVLLFLGLVVVTLVAARPLLAGTPLGGGALVPAWGGASGLWQEYLQGFHPVGLGSTSATPPYVALVALLATVLAGKPWLAVDVILIGCVPFAGAAAYLATRRVVRFAPVRVWAAATYALLPVGMGAVAAGRLGMAVVLALLPLAGVLAARMFTLQRRRARRAAWASGLVVAVAAAFVPLIWLIAVIAVAVGVLTAGRRTLAAAVDAAIVALVPAVLLFPWTTDLLTHPSQFFLEAGVQQPAFASPALPARSLLLLSPGGPGLPPVWVTVGLCAAAVAALLAAGRRRLVLAGWGLAAIGLVVAAGVTRISATPAAGGARVPAWPGVALAVAAGGLLLAVTAAGAGLPAALRAGRWRTPRGLAALTLAAVACSAPALAAASWVTSGVRGPAGPVTGQVLPEFVSVSSGTGLRLRTLVLRDSQHAGITYSVLRGTDPLLGSWALNTPPAAAHALRLTVAALTAPHGSDVEDQGRALAGFGIGYVLMPAPVNASIARLIDGAPGMQQVSRTGSFQLWRVVYPTARVTVTEPGGKVVTLPSGTTGVAAAKAPASGGTLVLAEPAGGWQASLNGHPLTALPAPVDGWAQGFRLPSGGGSLSISRSGIGRELAVALEAVALVVVAALGLPGAAAAGEPVTDGVGGDAGAGGQERARDGAGSRDRARGRRPVRGDQVVADADPVPGAAGLPAGRAQPPDADEAAVGASSRAGAAAAERGRGAAGRRGPGRGAPGRGMPGRRGLRRRAAAPVGGLPGEDTPAQSGEDPRERGPLRGRGRRGPTAGTPSGPGASAGWADGGPDMPPERDGPPERAGRGRPSRPVTSADRAGREAHAPGPGRRFREPGPADPGRRSARGTQADRAGQETAVLRGDGRPAVPPADGPGPDGRRGRTGRGGDGSGPDGRGPDGRPAGRRARRTPGRSGGDQHRGYRDGPGAGYPDPEHGTGPYDTGPYDTGPYDTGPYDTGPYDTGPYDTGPYDTGPYETRAHGSGPYRSGGRPYEAGPYGPGADGPGADGAGRPGRPPRGGPPRGGPPGDDQAAPPIPRSPRLTGRRRRYPDEHPYDHPYDGGDPSDVGAEPWPERGGPDW